MSAEALSGAQRETLLPWPPVSFEMVLSEELESHTALLASEGRASGQGGLQLGTMRTPHPEVSATTHCVKPGGGGAPQPAARRALRPARFP